MSNFAFPRFLLRTCIWLLLLGLPVSAFGADKVTLQLKWFHQFQFAGYYAAKEKGFYAAEGLDVVFRQRDIKTSYRDEIVELILKKYNPQKLSREHLLYEAEQTEKMIVPNFIELGSFKPSRFAKIAETYVALGLTDKISVDQDFLYASNKPLINLTPEEQIWLEEHPVSA